MSENTETPRSAAKSSRFTSILGLIAVAVLAGVLINQRYSTVESAVDWGKDLNVALAASAAESKPILLNFSSRGCGYCVQMEKEVIPQEEILAAINKYIPVKLDATKNEEASVRYEINFLPAYVIVDGNGTKLGMVDGFQPADEFEAFLTQGLALAKRH